MTTGCNEANQNTCSGTNAAFLQLDVFCLFIAALVFSMMNDLVLPYLCGFEEYTVNPTTFHELPFISTPTSDFYLCTRVLNHISNQCDKQNAEVEKTGEDHATTLMSVSRTRWMALLESDKNVMQTEQQQNKIIEVIIWEPKGHSHNSSLEELWAALEIMTFWVCVIWMYRQIKQCFPHIHFTLVGSSGILMAA